MVRWTAVAGAVTAAGLLAGCAGTATLPHHFVYDAYRPSYLSYAASRGGLLTEVVGNPFDAPKTAVDDAVTETFGQRAFGPKLDFFTEPPEGYSSAYRVVVLFDPAPGAAPARLCREPAQAQDKRPGRVGVLAAFCSGDRRITSAGGSVEGASGPDDPAFRRLMGQVSALLFPSRPGDRSPNDRNRAPGS